MFTGKFNQDVKEKIVEVVRAGGCLFHEHAVREAVDKMWRQGKQSHTVSLPAKAAKQRYSYIHGPVRSFVLVWETLDCDVSATTPIILYV